MSWYLTLTKKGGSSRPNTFHLIPEFCPTFWLSHSRLRPLRDQPALFPARAAKIFFRVFTSGDLTRSASPAARVRLSQIGGAF
jgi:hypothetical protein